MENEVGIPEPRQPEVGFPQPVAKKPRSKFLMLLIPLIGVILIIAVGSYFLLKGNSSESDAEPSPEGVLSVYATPTSVATAAPLATKTPEPAKKDTVAIKILNGTGVPGEASLLKTELEKLGFKKITAGNADDQNQTVTTVTFNKDLSDSISSEISKKLEALYTEVKIKRSSLTGDTDVEIVTGPRKKGATSPTSTSKATATPKPGSASPSPSATPTSSPTPTPTATTPT
jgi:hypothetical protein